MLPTVPALLLLLVSQFVAGRGQEPGSPPQGSAVQVTFEDIAEKAGITAMVLGGGDQSKKYVLESTGSGAALFDYDHDGLLDIFIVNGTLLDLPADAPRPTHHLYHNEGQNRFRDVTDQAGLAFYSGWGQGTCVGDYDNDGWEDLFVTAWGQNRLLRNKHDGTFADATREAGLTTPQTRWGSGCAFLDFDRDGFLDLFVANYVDFDIESAPLPGSSLVSCRWKGIPVFCGPRGLKGAQNVLYRNNRNGTFSDVSERAGILHPSGTYYGLGTVAADLDGDGWTDIYVACDSTANILYHNNQDGTFTDIGVESGAALNEDGKEQAGMGVGAGDFDQDGHLDLIVSNFSDDTPTLYHNNRDGSYTDITARALRGWNTRFLGWSPGFIDFDNDGWADLFFSNGHIYPEIEGRGLSTRYRQPKALYRNLGNGSFADVSARSGPGILLERSARGACFGDIDNDGDLDILVNNMNDRPTLLLNQGGNSNHWICLKLVGTRNNRSAIGARVRVVTGGKSQIDEVRSGGGWGSQNDLKLHFGLGRAAKVDSIEVRWPGGQLQKIQNAVVNTTLRIEEPTPTAQR